MTGFPDKPPTSFGIEETGDKFPAVVGHNGNFDRKVFNTKSEAMAYLQRREKEISLGR
ncbi:hypothetical protein [Ensifer sp. Root31]|uniref:hypothetical protein n=1 Tax=Ensifer sp. Root31 TaxID=1736512 RepID=UPI000A8D6AF6|nr:hypothetical protein [Ensifer sp. Root31]